MKTNNEANMTKREMLHVLIDKLLDVEETQGRGVHLGYDSSLGIEFYATIKPGAHRDRVGNPFRNFYFESEGIASALEEINVIKNTPNPEPLIEFKLTESRAIELGLIEKAV
jgi:hypothetical protein